MNYTFSNIDTVYRFYVLHSNGLNIFSIDFSSDIPSQVPFTKSISSNEKYISLNCNKSLKIVKDKQIAVEFIDINDFNDDDDIEKSINNSVNAENEKQTKSKKEEKPHVIGAKDSSVAEPNISPKTKKQKVDVDDIELSKRIEEFNKSSDEYADVYYNIIQKKQQEIVKESAENTLSAVDITTLHTVLSQAIQTNDKQIISFCLTNRDADV